MAVKTGNNRLAVLSTLIKYVKGERSRLRFKLDGMVGELEALPLADVETLLASTTDPRYRAVILLAMEAGLRVGEIRGLRWTDIKSDQHIVRRALWIITEADGSFVTFDKQSATVNAIYELANIQRPQAAPLPPAHSGR